MFYKTTYKTQLFSYFLVLFLIFAIIVGTFQYSREKEYKKKNLITRLSIYCDVIGQDIINISSSNTEIQEIVSLLPHDIRVTIINTRGSVLFDNEFDKNVMQNYLAKPEVYKADIDGTGYKIRYSKIANKDYFYYAKRFNNIIIRTALPYDIQAQDLLSKNNLVIYFMGAVFALMLFFIILISDRFSKAIIQLRDFSLTANPRENFKFPRGEIGEIGKRIIELYHNISIERLKVENERDKLTQHLKYSDEGIAIYSASRENIYANVRFIHIATLLTDMNAFNMVKILDQNEFKGFKIFLDQSHNQDSNSYPIKYQENISKHNIHASLKAIVFQDQSFEIILNDITSSAQNKELKKEITQSIAHELKTPVAALRGYLETLSTHTLPEEKRNHFLERAYLQAERLSDLVNDIAIITKLEEVPQLYNISRIDLVEIITDCTLDLEGQANEKGINIELKLPLKLPFNGNASLSQSIFHNLISNAIKYNNHGGKVIVDNYLSDDTFYYFSLSDDGLGIPEEHLTRIFERFYRVDDGRNRSTGGTGLGLSIVKNAVIFHGGEIKAKNNSRGGLEFLFTLKRIN